MKTSIFLQEAMYLKDKNNFPVASIKSGDAPQTSASLCGSPPLAIYRTGQRSLGTGRELSRNSEHENRHAVNTASVPSPHTDPLNESCRLSMQGLCATISASQQEWHSTRLQRN